jgi:hypothetical protein
MFRTKYKLCINYILIDTANVNIIYSSIILT